MPRRPFAAAVAAAVLTPLALAPVPVPVAAAAATAAKPAPVSIARSCPAVRAAGRTVSVDIVLGSTPCAGAAAAIRRFAAGKPPSGRLGAVAVGGASFSCHAFAPGSGFAWRYLCQSPTFATIGGGRLLPAADYRKL